VAVLLGDGLGVGLVLGDGVGVGPTVFNGGVGGGVGLGPTVFNGGVGDGLGVVLGDGETSSFGDGCAPGAWPGGVSKVALVSATPSGRVPQPAATMPPASAASTTTASNVMARRGVRSRVPLFGVLTDT
jgi:hypothetical protein